jgi:hypothetical protein
MKKLILLFLSINLTTFGQSVTIEPSQVGIQTNTAPISSAQLEVQSTTKAFYPPRMSTSQKNAILDPQAGAMVFDTNLNGLFFYNGTSWLSSSTLSIPYVQSKNSAASLFKIINSNFGGYNAIEGETNSGGLGFGIRGTASNLTPSAPNAGVAGINSATNEIGYGIYAAHYGTGIALKGETTNGTAASFQSTNGYAMESFGKIKIAGAGVGNLLANKFLKSTNTNGDAQWGDLMPYVASISNTASILKLINTNLGGYNAIEGEINSAGLGFGVKGSATNLSPSAPNAGVAGVNSSTNEIGYGVYARHYGIGIALRSETTNGIAASFQSENGYALITGTGRVGIGLSTPNNLLDVNGRMRIRHQPGYTSGVWMSNSTNDLGDAYGAFYGMKTDTETGIFIGNNWRFWVSNVGNGYLNGNLIQTSDGRLKKDFVLLSNSLASLSQLNGYHYKWKEESRSKELQTGLIAQEVQPIFPELVQTDESGFLSVNYIGMIPHLIESIKGLQHENAALKSKYHEVESQNQNLDSRLEKVEGLLEALLGKTNNQK